MSGPQAAATQCNESGITVFKVPYANDKRWLRASPAMVFWFTFKSPEIVQHFLVHRQKERKCFSPNLSDINVCQTSPSAFKANTS